MAQVSGNNLAGWFLPRLSYEAADKLSEEAAVTWRFCIWSFHRVGGLDFKLTWLLARILGSSQAFGQKPRIPTTWALQMAVCGVTTVFLRSEWLERQRMGKWMTRMEAAVSFITWSWKWHTISSALGCADPAWYSVGGGDYRRVWMPASESPWMPSGKPTSHTASSLTLPAQ